MLSDNDPISVVANRYSPQEIEMALYFLGGCLFLVVIAFCISAWIRSQADSPWQPLVKPISFNKKKQTDTLKCDSFDPYRTKRKKLKWWEKLLSRFSG